MLKAKSVITWLDFVHFVCIYAVFDKNIYFSDEKVILVNSSTIWEPDLYFQQLIRYSQQNMEKKPTVFSLTKKSPDAFVTVSYSFEANIKSSCRADFTRFPFHRHDCFLALGSWSKPNDSLRFSPDWNYDQKKLVNNFKTTNYLIETDYLSGDDAVARGVRNVSEFYSVVGLKLEMRHKYKKYIMLYYIPTSLIVVTSWVFFLLPSTSYPARTALLVTVFLLLINIFSGVVQNTPDGNDGSK